MKKLFFIVAALVFTATTAEAQLMPTAKIDAIEHLDAVRAKNVMLKKRGDLYYIAMTSTNRFDDLGIFELGTTVEGAAQTIADMIGLCKQLKEKESVVVNNRDQKVIIMVRKIIGKPYLQFDIPGIAGILSGITPKELARFYKVITGKDFSEK